MKQKMGTDISGANKKKEKAESIWKQGRNERKKPMTSNQL